ncbi:AraC family transcriptional regulator [Serratia fonticola]|uniref:AraC family transcriptional regulator n=1 Tax=Serratia fonticola TaxID=47917 RepID=UPI000BA26CC7|nr:helix-turn-helix domain-containing protein [Serratia fonticola]PAA95585.1 AraC family transcriptional regulator [Serratia fonticola]
MSETLVTLLEQLIAHQNAIQVRFPEPTFPAPPLAFCVPFPRLEIVLDGEVEDQCLPLANNTLSSYQVLYVPAGKWSFPQWTRPATTLSILFSKQKLGFSLQRWDGQALCETQKQHVARRGPRVGSYLLLAMNEVLLQPDALTSQLIFTGLVSHCLEQLAGQGQTVSKSQELLLAIQDYLDDHAGLPLTREGVAKRFHITPNYLSHLFQKSGPVGFNEYITGVRLERAKNLLRGYDLKIKEIAHSCGFDDSNYFCRIFKKHTDRSPSEYRRHCRSL